MVYLIWSDHFSNIGPTRNFSSYRRDSEAIYTKKLLQCRNVCTGINPAFNISSGLAVTSVSDVSSTFCSVPQLF